jgi:multiple sugar transport system substrate-binding protein
MKKRHIGKVVLGIAVVSAMLLGTACGGSSTATTAAAKAAATTKAAAATTKAGTAASTTKAAAATTKAAAGATTAAAKDSGKPVTLRVALWDYSNTQYYKTIFDAFTKANPNIKLDIVEFTAAEYEDTVTTQLAGKQDFDIVFIKSLPTMANMIQQGMIKPIDDYMTKDKNFDKSKYTGYIEQLALNGKTYGIPFRKDNNLIYYNKDLFDKASVPYPKDDMSFKEYADLARKMTSGSGNSKVYGAHFHVWPTNVSTYARRTESFDPNDSKTYSSLTDLYTETLKLQDEGVIQDYGALKSSNIHYSGVFYNQQAAMMQMGTWYINMLFENVKDFKWGVCSVPTPDGKKCANAEGGVTPVTIGSFGKNPDAAWKFMTYICGEEGAKSPCDNRYPYRAITQMRSTRSLMISRRHIRMHPTTFPNIST